MSFIDELLGGGITPDREERPRDSRSIEGRLGYLEVRADQNTVNIVELQAEVRELRLQLNRLMAIERERRDRSAEVYRTTEEVNRNAANDANRFLTEAYGRADLSGVSVVATIPPTVYMPPRPPTQNRVESNDRNLEPGL